MMKFPSLVVHLHESRRADAEALPLLVHGRALAEDDLSHRRLRPDREAPSSPVVLHLMVACGLATNMATAHRTALAKASRSRRCRGTAGWRARGRGSRTAGAARSSSTPIVQKCAPNAVRRERSPAQGARSPSGYQSGERGMRSCRRAAAQRGLYARARAVLRRKEANLPIGSQCERQKRRSPRHGSGGQARRRVRRRAHRGAARHSSHQWASREQVMSWASERCGRSGMRTAEEGLDAENDGEGAGQPTRTPLG